MRKSGQNRSQTSLWQSRRAIADSPMGLGHVPDAWTGLESFSRRCTLLPWTIWTIWISSSASHLGRPSLSVVDGQPGTIRPPARHPGWRFGRREWDLNRHLAHGSPPLGFLTENRDGAHSTNSRNGAIVRSLHPSPGPCRTPFLRVRNWCGASSPATSPATSKNPAQSERCTTVGNLANGFHGYVERRPIRSATPTFIVEGLVGGYIHMKTDSPTTSPASPASAQ